MSVVHLLSNASSLSSCLKNIEQDDALLLLGNGVFAAYDEKIKGIGVPIAAIDEDAVSRGVQLMPYVQPVSYEEFVGLVVKHDSSVSWT